MKHSSPGQSEGPGLQSVDDYKPTEEGGSAARGGFSYQDEIAACFLIEMLGDPAILRVHCETHDDVLVVRDGAETRVAEFVQVKAIEADKLWSVADLCAKKAGKTGSSIYELSLARDRCTERSLFRIATLRPVVSELQMLTFPIGATGRESEGERFQKLLASLTSYFPGLISTKGNGAEFWLSNCFWDVRNSEPDIHRANILALLVLGVKESRRIFPESAEVLLEELLAWVKRAGSAKWEPDKIKKIITRAQARAWWERRTTELLDGAHQSGGKLREKMEEAGLPSEVIELAVDLRRRYSAAVRTPHYMPSEELDRLQDRVRAAAALLQSLYVAGRTNQDGVAFHASCLERMDAINSERPSQAVDQLAHLQGCLYDIADRCLLRFTRPS